MGAVGGCGRKRLEEINMWLTFQLMYEEKEGTARALNQFQCPSIQKCFYTSSNFCFFIGWKTEHRLETAHLVNLKHGLGFISQVLLFTSHFPQFITIIIRFILYHPNRERGK